MEASGQPFAWPSNSERLPGWLTLRRHRYSIAWKVKELSFPALLTERPGVGKVDPSSAGGGQSPAWSLTKEAEGKEEREIGLIVPRRIGLI
jgi:hypothetical protein